MLIVFIAFVAMFDAILGKIVPDLTLSKLFGWIFSPAAFLMGVEQADVSSRHVAGNEARDERTRGLLANERLEDHAGVHDRPLVCAGGIRVDRICELRLRGHPAWRHRRDGPGSPPDLARLGLRALFVGFTATLLNAAIAGIFI
ncbi:MAG: nucleoside transporter C-terminal domain-containing protein [Verrucomicrobiota bacterium]